jgi:hypothetical protein
VSLQRPTERLCTPLRRKKPQALRAAADRVRKSIVYENLPSPRFKELSPHIAGRGLVLDPRKLRDVVAGVLESDELATARQRYQIVARRQRTRSSHAGDRVSTCHPMTRG